MYTDRTCRLSGYRLSVIGRQFRVATLARWSVPDAARGQYTDQSSRMQADVAGQTREQPGCSAAAGLLNCIVFKTLGQ
jgi:hypothetical protein